MTASNSAGTGAASATVSGTPAKQPKPLSITPILGGFSAGATVEIFRADTGERLDIKTLGADGTATVTVPAAFTGLVVVRVSGDSAAQYLDERTDSLKTFSSGQFLLAVVPPSGMSSRATPIAVSTLTHAIAVTAGVSTSSTANTIASSTLTSAGLQTAQNKVLDSLGLTSDSIDPLKVPVYLKASDRGRGAKLEGSGEALNHGVLLIAIAKLAPESTDLARFAEQLGVAIKANTVGSDIPQITQLPQRITSATNSFVAPSSQNQVTVAPSPVLVSTSAGVGGAISPTSISARKGTAVSLSLSADIGYENATVSGCAGALSGSTYTTGALTDSCTVSATFKLKTYTVTASAGANGSISPSSRSVEHGSSATFTVTPNAGYGISSISGCGGTLNGSTYTTSVITSVCTVSAAFIENFNVTAVAGTGGSISPGSVAVKSGLTTTFTVTPGAAYDIDAVSGCGGTLSGNTYTTGAVTAACTVNATFKLKKYTVTASAGTGGSISPASASVDHGTTIAFTVTPQSDYVISSVSGCSGSLSGNTYTTGAVTATCSVTASFIPKVATTSIAGVWSGVDSARPAFISVSSAADDSFLKVVQLKTDGSFEVTGLDASKTYIVEPEQSGSRPASAVQYVTASTQSNNDRVYKSSTTADNPLAISAKPGTYLSINGIRIPGLTDGEFTYRWEGNPTASGAEYSSYVPNPIKVELIPNSTPVADPQAAVRLAEEYGIVLVNPSSSPGDGELAWTAEYAERFRAFAEALDFPTVIDPLTRKPRENLKPTFVTLTAQALPEDLERKGATYLQDRFSISEAAFAHAVPALARVEGRRGIFFSNRLFRALVRVRTNGGTDLNTIAALAKQRYGITVSSDPNRPMVLPYAPATCSAFPSDCQQAEWRTFKPDELLDLVSILEEYPQPLRDLSAPSSSRGLRFFLRRRDGVLHPKYKPSDAVAWISASYAEFMEKGFGGVQLDGIARERDRAQRYQLIVHEKAHFVWSNTLDDRTRLDWAKLSGWWKSPLKPGEDPKVVGKCSEWEKDPASWTPPNTVASDLIFDGSFGHDPDISDADELRSSWGSCSTTQFVSAYAAFNPNEDFADSFAAFMVNPELLRSRALPKYEFLRDRLMQGVIYLSRIRQDLTFQVLNLYPDYVYPGKIKSIQVTLTGKPEEDKNGKIRIELHTSTCSASSSSACFEGASSAYLQLISRILPDGNQQDMPVGLSPVDSSGAILEGSFTLSKFAAAGWWQAPQITIRDKVGNERQQKATSGDYGWKLYVNSPLEDVDAPMYIKNSVRLRLLSVSDAGISTGLSGDERELVVSWRSNEKNPPSYGSCQASLVNASDRSSFGMVGNSRVLSSGQPDGATMECVARWIVTRFFPTDLYSLSAIYTDDLARNRREIRLSPQGKDPTIEKSPEVMVTSPNSDLVAPVLNIAACKTDSLDEACLRISAKPTNPSAPDGETTVDLYYWGYEEEPLASASGLGRVDFALRDPLGKTFSYPAECRDWYGGNAFGVEGKCPIDIWVGVVTADSTQYTNKYFLCPDGTGSKPERTTSTRAGCTAVTPVQYHARVVLPRGSAPGTWGLVNMSVRDKVRNSRGYDFTELFRFTPTGSDSSQRERVFRSSGSQPVSNPFTFEVAGAGSKPETLTTVMISTAKSAWTSVIDTMTGWVSRATGYVSNGVSRAMARLQGGARIGVKYVRNELAGLVPGMAGTAASTLEAAVERATSAETVVVSISEDSQTGSRYQIIRQQTDIDDSPQRWTLEYRSNTGALFAAARLPDTSEVLWRGTTGSHGLSTTGWTRICSDRVWSVQDGYQMLFSLADRSLSDVRPGQLWVNSQSEVTVISDVRCAFGGAVWIEGYAFSASDKEPLLRGDRVVATRFGFALDRLGSVSKRNVEPIFFEAPKHCADPANEQLLFCSEVKRAVGW